MKKIGLIAIACSIGLALQAQVIDSLNGDSLSEYTTTLVLDNSDGAGAGVAFSDASGSLTAAYTGSVSDPEQALFLAPATDFSTVFAVGDMLSVNVNTPASGTTEDFGLAIAATAAPTAAGSGNGYNSRGTLDWASVSVRPSQSSVRINTSISGTVTTGNNVAGVGSTANISELFINWVSADSFQLGYISNNVSVVDATATFAPGSTIGTAIGFYGDLRATGTSLGSLSDLSIQPVPEPATLALFALGSGSLLLLRRRR
jgi:PEP-CTERM motif